MEKETKFNLLDTSVYSNHQLTILVILRVLIGWHMLYEGVTKLINPYWSSASFLVESKGLFSFFFTWLTESAGRLSVVDFLNIWGLIAIGLGLILGVFTRVATISGIVLVSFYYLAQPPFIGLKYSAPSEGSYLIVNKNLIEVFALWILALFPTGKIIGIDRFIHAFFKKE